MMLADTRLEQLAVFGPALRNPRASFVRERPLSGSGTDADPYQLVGSFALTDTGLQFVQMAHDAGWVIMDFNWAEWVQTAEAQQLLTDRTALSAASEDQLAKVMTALMGESRFVEGRLEQAFRDGLIRAVAERAEALCAAADS